MGVPLNVIDCHCFLKVVPAMQQFVSLILRFQIQLHLRQYLFPLAVLPVKLLFAEADYNHSKNLKSISVKRAVQSAYMYQSQEVLYHSADKGCG